jgi:hypothetical protein
MIGYYSTILKDKDVSSNVKRMILMERAGLKVPPNKKNDAEEELDKTKLKDDALEKTFSDVKDDEFEYELEEIIKELEDYIDDKEEEEEEEEMNEEEDVVDFLKNIDFDCVCK